MHSLSNMYKLLCRQQYLEKNSVYGCVLLYAEDLGRRRRKDLLLASATRAKNAAAEHFDCLPDEHYRCRAGATTRTFAYSPTKSSTRFFTRPMVTNAYPLTFSSTTRGYLDV